MGVCSGLTFQTLPVEADGPSNCGSTTTRAVTRGHCGYTMLLTVGKHTLGISLYVGVLAVVVFTSVELPSREDAVNVLVETVNDALMQAKDGLEMTVSQLKLV